MKYIPIAFQDVQDYMDEEWFEEEAVLDIDSKLGLGLAAYLIPEERINDAASENCIKEYNALLNKYNDLVTEKVYQDTMYKVDKITKELEHQKTINKSLFNKNKLLNDTIDGLEANDLNKKLKDYSEKYHKLVVKYNALLTVNKTLLNIKNIDVTSIGSIDYFQQKVNVNETTIKFLKEEINALYYNLRKKDIKLEIMQGHNDKLRRTRKSLKQEVEHFKAVIQSLKKYHNQSN